MTLAIHSMSDLAFDVGPLSVPFRKFMSFLPETLLARADEVIE
jgi:hypothetical protein